jgi:uncharacterized protein
MFHTIITLAYTIPNIYVFLRIWKLFINKEYRLHYILIYILLALVYPLSNLFGDNGFPGGELNLAGNYILPFYLYLFLSVLAFDIFLLFNRIFEIVPSEKMKRTSFRKAGLSTIILISIGVVIAGIINFNTIRVSEYKIGIPAKSSQIYHFRIAFAADFHLKESTNIHFVERFVQKISDLEPDLMIFGGDIVEGDRDDGNISVSATLLSKIKSTYGTYVVLGNHEHYAGEGIGNFFDNAGMKVLNDTIIKIDSAFYLAGRKDSHVRNRKTVDELLRNATDSLPIILIDHRPTEIGEVSKTRVDVQLSGHTHNGQLFPINLITRKVYDISWGYRKIGKTHFFVTSGIRLWGPPVRTTAKSEIMIIDLFLKQDEKNLIHGSK